MRDSVNVHIIIMIIIKLVKKNIIIKAKVSLKGYYINNFINEEVFGQIRIICIN